MKMVILFDPGRQYERRKWCRSKPSDQIHMNDSSFESRTIDLAIEKGKKWFYRSILILERETWNQSVFFSQGFGRVARKSPEARNILDIFYKFLFWAKLSKRFPTVWAQLSKNNMWFLVTLFCWNVLCSSWMFCSILLKY